MVVSVLVEITSRNTDKMFDYQVPKSIEEQVKIGIRVVVPFANRTLQGFILEVKEQSEYQELKEIIEVIDTDVVLTSELLELGKYIKETTLATLIQSYQVMLPKALKASKKRKPSIQYDKWLSLAVDRKRAYQFAKNEKQKEIIQRLEEKDEVLYQDLVMISPSSVKTLLHHGIVKEEKREHYRLVHAKEDAFSLHQLTDEQQQVVDKIMQGKKLVNLLHGVTGSGKTEVYMALIDEVLKLGKTAIVLVPEISLTPQIIARFQSHFGNIIAILHSGLSDGEKYDEWRKINRKEVKIVIGARSAIFAPLENIGIIIIDEEHSTTYKQENNPRYHVIDVAIKRAKTHQCSVLLGSATPSLESYARAQKGVYQLLELPHRVNGKSMPKVYIIDKKVNNKESLYFSTELMKAIKSRLEKGEQTILFLNKRGYSSYVTCQNCGYTEKCPHCDITLTYHKSSTMLRCHYCGYAINKKNVCPECHQNSFRDLGMGTERLEEEMKRLFPLAKVVRMDLDTTTTKDAHKKIIDAFSRHEYDILIGTQMIAKGLDFPLVTLVGVINADTSLNIPDFRSGEYTFQLLNQVAGRCGRKDLEGEVYIQTFNKDHYAIKLTSTYDYQNFYRCEMNFRRQLKYPPFYYLTLVKVLSKNEQKALEISTIIAKILNRDCKESTILGPSMSNVFRINNVYRYLVLVKYKSEPRLYEVLEKILNHYKTQPDFSIEVDFNPLFVS